MGGSSLRQQPFHQHSGFREIERRARSVVPTTFLGAQGTMAQENQGLECIGMPVMSYGCSATENQASM